MEKYGNGIGQGGTLHAGNVRWDSFLNPTALGQNFDSGIDNVMFPCPMLENENIPKMFLKEPSVPTYSKRGTYNELKGPGASTPYTRAEEKMPATKRALMTTRGPTKTRPSVVNPTYPARPATDSIHRGLGQLKQAQKRLDAQMKKTGNRIMNVMDAKGTILTQLNTKIIPQNVVDMAAAIHQGHNIRETVDIRTGLHSRGVVAHINGAHGLAHLTGAENERFKTYRSIGTQTERPEVALAERAGAQTAITPPAPPPPPPGSFNNPPPPPPPPNDDDAPQPESSGLRGGEGFNWDDFNARRGILPGLAPQHRIVHNPLNDTPMHADMATQVDSGISIEELAGQAVKQGRHVKLRNQIRYADPAPPSYTAQQRMPPNAHEFNMLTMGYRPENPLYGTQPPVYAHELVVNNTGTRRTNPLTEVMEYANPQEDAPQEVLPESSVSAVGRLAQSEIPMSSTGSSMTLRPRTNPPNYRQ